MCSTSLLGDCDTLRGLTGTAIWYDAPMAHHVIAAVVGAAIIHIALSTTALAQQLTFTDATAAVGISGINAARLCFADLNADARPDAIIRAIETKDGKPAPDRYRVFLNVPSPSLPPGGPAFKFVELATPTGLPTPQGGDCLVFADLDNDGHADAIFTRSLDIHNPKFVEPPAPARTCWLKGKGDGTFGESQIIEAAKRATTACIAVGDVNRDGRLDLYLGNWYANYGETNDAFTNDLILQQASPAGIQWTRDPLPEDIAPKDEDRDMAGRPTFGAFIGHLFASNMHVAEILELNYGRRANRLWSWTPDQPEGIHDVLRNMDLAPALGLDGDADRSGTYPGWLKERAKTDARFDRQDEKPFRSHGNTFDAAIGDVDCDGDFDVFLAEITHAWGGPSSDRSRFLVNRSMLTPADATQGVKEHAGFVHDPRLCVDRLPADPSVRNWNQGDMFAELADFDNDGRLDLLLSSGDYPDDQHLRLYRQQDDGRFVDITPWTGINNEGSLQISLADVDGDGDMDILVGESFNRLNAAQIAGRAPSIKLYLNQTVEKRQARLDQGLSLDGVVRSSVTLRLTGDGTKGVSRDGLGAIVSADVNLDGNPATPPTRIVRQLIGIGGHAGKQHEFLVHIPLGAAAKADKIVIQWPGRDVPDTVLTDVDAGHHDIELGEHTPASAATPEKP